MRVQNELQNTHVVEVIKELEEVLSSQGVHRSYQDDLAIYTLSKTFADLEKMVRLRKPSTKDPSFLKESFSWADHFITDFGTAWTSYYQDLPREGLPTLAERNIDLSKFVGRDFGRGLSKKPDVAQLRVSDMSADFVHILSQLYMELKTFFVSLEKLVQTNS